MTNALTLGIWLLPWALWLVWEVYLLLRRAQPGPKVKTISMVARDMRFRITSVVYLLPGMCAHWFWLGPKNATVVGGIAFWVIALALLVQDIWLRNKPTETWPQWLLLQRDAPAWMLIGALAGRYLFPQGVS